MILIMGGIVLVSMFLTPVRNSVFPRSGKRFRDEMMEMVNCSTGQSCSSGGGAGAGAGGGGTQIKVSARANNVAVGSGAGAGAGADVAPAAQRGGRFLGLAANGHASLVTAASLTQTFTLDEEEEDGRDEECGEEQQRQRKLRISQAMKVGTQRQKQRILEEEERESML